MIRLTILMVMLLISSMAMAKIYKWVDANGVVHFQDHPRGSTEIFSTTETSAKKTGEKKKNQKPATTKLLKEMEKSRKQRERARKQEQAKARKQAEQCINYRFKTDKLAAKMKKKYSQFNNDLPPEYDRLKKQLDRRQQYLDKYCN